MKKRKIDVKATLGGILQIIFTGILIIIIGITFSYFTGYTANDHNYFIRVIVWLLNIIISWCLTTLILKIFFRKKISFLDFKFFLGALAFSVLIVFLIGNDEEDYSYITAFITLATIFGVFSTIKFAKKKKGKLKNETTDIDKNDNK